MTDDAVWCFPVCLEGTGTVLRLRWTLGMVLSNPFRQFFPQTQMISSHLCANQYLAQFLERFSTDLWSSLSVKVSLLVFCCIHSSCFGLSRLSVFSTQGVSWLPPLDSLSLGCSLEILSRQYTGTNVGLFLFVSYLSRITVLHCLLSSVMKIIVLLYFVCFFGGFRQKGKSGFSYFKYSYYYWGLIIC